MTVIALESLELLSDGLARRDASAFSEVVRRYDSSLVRMCTVMAGDPEAAKDAVQETWSRVWRNPPVLRDASALPAWLRTVAINEVRQRQRRRAILDRLLRRTSWNRASQGAGDPQAGVAVRDLLRRLQPPDRELLALRYVAGLTSVEISTLRGVTPEAIRSRLHRLRRQLAEEFSDVD